LRSGDGVTVSFLTRKYIMRPQLRPRVSSFFIECAAYVNEEFANIKAEEEGQYRVIQSIGDVTKSKNGTEYSLWSVYRAQEIL